MDKEEEEVEAEEGSPGNTASRSRKGLYLWRLALAAPWALQNVLALVDGVKDRVRGGQEKARALTGVAGQARSGPAIRGILQHRRRGGGG